MKASKHSPKKAKSLKRTPTTSALSAQQLLQMGQIRFEKCELKEARENYGLALELSKSRSDFRGMMEAVAGLLRLAGEALDEVEVKRLEKELASMMGSHPESIPPMAWYCKAVINRHRGECLIAQRNLRLYLRTVRADADSGAKKAAPSEPEAELFTYDELVARGWIMLAIVLWQRGRYRRSLHLVEILLSRLEAQNLRGVNGMLYHLTGSIYEKLGKYDLALSWFQKAHAAFLGSHSWYFHLYVLYAYARLARHSRSFAQAYWYLDLIEKAVQSPEFGLLKREIALERSRLEGDAVDLLIDSRQCVIQTREGGEISLRKQYVLLHILEALSQAHHGSEAERERGLSKAEIIETVWKEIYRPEAHDNKLYYNINRLRKLIEPDVHKPRYLVNWKEGYRLAPGLKIQYIGSASGSPLKTEERPKNVNSVLKTVMKSTKGGI